MSDTDYNYIRVKSDTAMDPLLRRLLGPPFGTETSERNLMADAAARIAELERQIAEARDQALEDARQAVHEALVGNPRYDAARLTARDAIRAMKGAKP